MPETNKDGPSRPPARLLEEQLEVAGAPCTHWTQLNVQCESLYLAPFEGEQGVVPLLGLSHFLHQVHLPPTTHRRLGNLVFALTSERKEPQGQTQGLPLPLRHMRQPLHQKPVHHGGG